MPIQRSTPVAPEPTPKTLLLVYGALVATMALWGGTWPAGRIVARTVTPWNAAFIRFFLATGPLVVLCIMMEGRSALVIAKRHLPRVVLLGVAGIFGYSAFFFAGLQTAEASRGALIIGFIPASIALTSAILLGERLRWVGIAGIMLALLGVGTVMSHGSPARLLRGEFAVGDLFLLGCVACWTSYTLIGKPLMKELSPLVVVTWSCIIGTACLAPFALGSGLTQAIAHTDREAWWALLYLGPIGTSLGYCWYYWALHQLGSMRTGIFINLVPIFGVALGSLTLKEPLTLSLLTGGMLVVGGVVLTVKAGRQKVVDNRDSVTAEA